MSCFFCQIIVFKTVSWVELFFFFCHKNMSLVKLKNSLSLSLSLSHFFLPSIQQVNGETILPNIFFQSSLASFRKLFMKLFFKNSALLVKLSCAKQSQNKHTRFYNL